MRLHFVAAIFTLVFLISCSQHERRGSATSTGTDEAETISHDLGPFFYAETEMYDNMRAAIGTSSGDNWVRMMIAHHEGGAALSRIVLRENPSSCIADLARETMRVQVDAVGVLRALEREGPLDVESAFIFLKPIQGMHDATMSVIGANASEIWLRKMIAHHRGAIAMSEVLLKQPAVPRETVNAVRRVRSAQLSDLVVLERALAEPELIDKSDGRDATTTVHVRTCPSKARG